MATNNFKYIENSNIYKYVQKYKVGNKIKWLGKVLKNGKTFETEREAALYVDKILINKGKKQVNILIPN